MYLLPVVILKMVALFSGFAVGAVKLGDCGTIASLLHGDLQASGGLIMSVLISEDSIRSGYVKLKLRSVASGDLIRKNASMPVNL